MARVAEQDLVQRRQIEDELLGLGAELEQLAHRDSWNRERIRHLLGPAREAGITVRDISRLTGLSTQTLHTWLRDLMRPIPAIHVGLCGPAPQRLDESVLRTMGEEPNREWEAEAVVEAMPAGWPTGSVADVDAAMGQLARGLMIWEGDSGYRVAPPDAAA
jgi:lambda repressor-like predicted transcriptional regulator